MYVSAIAAGELVLVVVGSLGNAGEQNRHGQQQY